MKYRGGTQSQPDAAALAVETSVFMYSSLNILLGQNRSIFENEGLPNPWNIL